MRRLHLSDSVAWLALCWPEFVDHQEGLFLARGLPEPRPDLTHFHDLTDAEAFYNHIHILDEFQHNALSTNPELGAWDSSHPDFRLACDLGKQVAVMWHAKLRCEHPHCHVRVYYTQNDNPIVRFHCVRPGDPVWLDESSWQAAIESGEVLILDSMQMRGDPLA